MNDHGIVESQEIGTRSLGVVEMKQKEKAVVLKGSGACAGLESVLFQGRTFHFIALRMARQAAKQQKMMMMQL